MSPASRDPSLALLAIAFFDSRPGDAKRNLLLLVRSSVSVGLPSAVERRQENFLSVLREPANRRRQIRGRDVRHSPPLEILEREPQGGSSFFEEVSEQRGTDKIVSQVRIRGVSR